MGKPITIVIIRALGYSGATWTNVVFGCHPRVMAVGPPHRFWKLERGAADQACLIHRERCSVWRKLVKRAPAPADWFGAIAEATGKDVFVLNYPDRAFVDAVIAPSDAKVLHVKLARDGRASLYSRMRHKYGVNKVSAFRNIVEWQIPKWDQVERKLPDDPREHLFLRYEDLVLDAQRALARVGEFIGVDYDARSAVRFWDWEHHLTAGNVGMLDMICRLQGLEGYEHARRAEYSRVIDEIRAGGTYPSFIDESWQTGLSREDRLAFDCLLGEHNAAHGYERDSFEVTEVEEFWARYEDRRSAVSDELEAERVSKAPYSPPGIANRLLARTRRITIDGLRSLTRRIL